MVAFTDILTVLFLTGALLLSNIVTNLSSVSLLTNFTFSKNKLASPCFHGFREAVGLHISKSKFLYEVISFSRVCGHNIASLARSSILFKLIYSISNICLPNKSRPCRVASDLFGG